MKKYVNRLSVLFFILIIATSTIYSQSFVSGEKAKNEPVILDEEYEDWTGVEDIANASGSGNTTIKAQNHSGFLFLYLEVEDMVELQGDNRMVMYLDTDNNSETGTSVNGIGAEVKFDFGSRSGTVSLNGSQYSIGPRALSMAISPTVWSDRFEISIDRDAQFGGSDLFTSEEINIIFEDKTTGTYSPSESGGASYTFDGTSTPELPSYSIQNPADSLLRVMSHNVLFDNLFDTDHKSSFKRMYQTILPDVIGFQEIYDHSADETAAVVEEFIPSGDDENWYSERVDDNIIVSRYAVKEVHSIGQNGAFLLDLRPDYNTDVLVINAHTPCCDNHQSRQEEIDAMMAFVRDAKNGTGEMAISEDTPIMLMGDMNVVGDPQNIETLLTGDIVDESTYGNDFTPGWNGNNFTDAKPLVSGLPMTFTHWPESGAGNYSWGRLDMIVYSGSVMSLENSYVMYTNSLSQDTLDQYPMQKADSEGASDHLPLVADFNIEQTSSSSSSLDIKKNFKDQVFNGGDTVTIEWDVENVNKVDLFYKFENDEDWTLISDNIVASELSYNWVVPQEVEDSCMIKLANSENSNMYDLSGKFYVEKGESVSIGNKSDNVSEGIDVSPNPFENELVVEFSLSEKGPLVIDLFKQNGEKVKTYEFSAIEARKNRLILNTNDISTGIYFLRVKATDEFLATQRIVKIR